MSTTNGAMSPERLQELIALDCIPPACDVAIAAVYNYMNRKGEQLTDRQRVTIDAEIILPLRNKAKKIRSEPTVTLGDVLRTHS